jgi:hypothetical protein
VYDNAADHVDDRERAFIRAGFCADLFLGEWRRYEEHRGDNNTHASFRVISVVRRRRSLSADGSDSISINILSRVASGALRPRDSFVDRVELASCHGFRSERYFLLIEHILENGDIPRYVFLDREAVTPVWIRSLVVGSCPRRASAMIAREFM